MSSRPTVEAVFRHARVDRWASWFRTLKSVRDLPTTEAK